MKIGKRIEELRKLKGYNQSQLARLAKIKAPSISQYENEKRIPSLTALLKLSIVLGTSTDFLLNGKNQTNDKDRDMLVLFNSLLQDDKDHALNYLKFLALKSKEE